MHALPAQGTCSYNGHTFSASVETQSIESRPVYDSAERTVTHVIHTIVLLDRVLPAAGSITAIDADMLLIRRRLTTAGGALRYQNKGFGDFTINVGSVKDVVWGPKPELLSFKPWGGNQGAEITWQVQVAIPECSQAKYDGIVPMEFNYTMAWSIDEAGYTRRVTAGHVRVPQTRYTASDRRLRYTADTMYEKVVPSLPIGFKRVSQDRTLSEDKCKLTFSIVDEQLPRELPPGVIRCNVGHTVNSTTAKDGKVMSFALWNASINAEYEVDRHIPRAQLWKHFWDLAASRIVQARDRSQAGGQIFPVLPLAFSARESEVYGRAVGNFSLSYCFGSSIKELLITSGLFLTVPDAGGYVAWRASLADWAHHPRGHAQMNFSPASDAIIDLCVTESPLVPQASRQSALRFQLPPSPFFQCPPAAQSWLIYRNNVEVEHLDQSVELKPLPENPITILTAALAAVAVSVPKGGHVPGQPAAKFISTSIPYQTPYPPAKLHSIVQNRASPTIIVTLSGYALRTCYAIASPVLTSVGGIPATPYNRRGQGFRTAVVSNLGGLPIAAAVWRLSWLLNGVPLGFIGPPPNPSL